MKKGVRLFTTLMVCMVMALCVSCKKDEKVYVAKVQAETPDITTTANAATISGTYSYVSTMKSVVIVYGKDASLSSPQKVTAEHTRDSYSVTINNLDPSTKYYYYCIFDTGYGASESEQWSFTTLGNGGGGGGRFSVSSTTTVEFAPGNLYYDGSAFRFEENQWSFADTWNASHVSHFFWSKTASVAYASSYSDSGASTGDVFFTEASGFQVSGETAGTWRTFSKAEWIYLLNSRTGASSLRAWVTLTDVSVSGLVILPDGSSATASGITTSSALAASGAVFLPAAGDRYGTDVDNVGSNGYYWSSMSHDSYYAYGMHFNSGNVYTLDGYRGYGNAVRLVR